MSPRAGPPGSRRHSRSDTSRRISADLIWWSGASRSLDPVRLSACVETFVLSPTSLRPATAAEIRASSLQFVRKRAETTSRRRRTRRSSRPPWTRWPRRPSVWFEGGSPAQRRRSRRRDPKVDREVPAAFRQGAEADSDRSDPLASLFACYRIRAIRPCVGNLSNCPGSWPGTTWSAEPASSIMRAWLRMLPGWSFSLKVALALCSARFR